MSVEGDKIVETTARATEMNATNDKRLQYQVHIANKWLKLDTSYQSHKGLSVNIMEVKRFCIKIYVNTSLDMFGEKIN